MAPSFPTASEIEEEDVIAALVVLGLLDGDGPVNVTITRR
jgi:hypothetical protein